MDSEASTSSGSKNANEDKLAFVEYRDPGFAKELTLDEIRNKHLKRKAQDSDDDESETNNKDESDIEYMCTYLDTLHIIKKDELFAVKDFSKYIEMLPVAFQNFGKWKPPIPYDLMMFNVNFKYPEHFMKPNDVIGHQWISRNKQVSDYIEIIVSELFDPSKFWVHLVGRNNHDALNELMNEMQVFYKQHAKSLQVNRYCVCSGMYVASMFVEEFHRAQIIEVCENDKLKVFYIDYGTVATVSIKDLYFLYNKFAKLPKQAIRASLYNIIPKDNSIFWSTEASMCMVSLVQRKILYGQIAKINLEEQLLDLIMIDTTTPDDDIHVNEELVKKGHAILGNNDKLKSFSFVYSLWYKYGPKDRIRFTKIDEDSSAKRRKLT